MNAHDEPRNPTGAFPTLQARDADAMLQFLLTLGFVENAVYRDDDNRIVHAQLDWPAGGGIMFGTHRPENEWTREPGTAGVYLVAEDVDAAYARAQEARGEVIRPLADTDYESREFVVRDPEGNLWSIGTYPGEPRASNGN